jgi:sugar O-acyltransferase (sialic acid O-acetyltransferase NeuD family)
MPLAEHMLAAEDQEDCELVFVDENRELRLVNGHRVLHPEAFLASSAEKHFNITITDYCVRERFAREFAAGDAKPFTITAANSVCLRENVIGEGAILCAYTTITSNATIGKFFHANIYSYVAHDCVIGDFVTFAPDVHCNGGVIVEDYAYIGTGAILRQGTQEKPLVIGRGAVVGMGAVVTKSVAPFTTVVGNPAAPLKTQT